METTKGSIVIGVLKTSARSVLKIFFLLFYLAFSVSGKAQLIINEVSQGASAAKEYVELLVVGTPTCTTVPCMDLRGYYLDDNNGNHATGAGTGIAQGCIRFSTDPLWSCVPVGTLIVIYNDADLNPSVPAQDLSLTDGNCVLVIPVSNCTLIEKHTTLPSTTTSTYPTTGFVPCGSWTNISMANTDDSFQTIDPSGNLVFSVSWGNNTVADIIYFAGGQSALVSYNTNAVDNNPFNQANWVKAAVAGNETPGAPNNAANAAWINSMNNSCGTILPLTLTFTATPTACGCTGSATVTPSGAVGPYTYLWSPGGITTNTIGSLCKGNYTVTVNSSNGCVVSDTVPIISSVVLTNTITSTNVSCNGSSDGTATVNVSGSPGPFTYTWSPVGGSNATATNLPAGNYTVDVADVGGCLTSATVTITQPIILTATITSTDITCFGANNGTANVNASGGTGIYAYSWSPSGGINSSATNLPPGNFTVTVTDAKGCTTLASTLIAEPSQISPTVTTTSITCNGANNGSATVTATGGTGAYTYSWSPSGGNSANAANLSSGNYSVNVTDANGCVVTSTLTISQPNAITTTVTSVNPLCFGGNGSATITVSGGSGAYTYSWSPSGGTNPTASLAAANYTVTISDANACTTSAAVSIMQPTVLTASITSTDITCFGANNGTANANASGGTGAYTYSWAPAGGTNSTANNLAQGNYTVTITDANGCTTTASTLISEPAQVSLTLTSTSVTCNGAGNGTASVTATGGTGAFTYTWSPIGGNASNASALPAGNYSVNVTDANGCLASSTFTITQPSIITSTMSATNAICFGGSGSATVTVSGGTGAYTYSWSPIGGTNSSANLPMGNFTVTISDANNCSVSNTVSITQPTALTASVTSTSITCFGANNGTTNVNASGGTGAYTYSWSPAGGTNPSANNLSQGNYTVAITDANGCAITASTLISEPAQISLAITFTSVTCNGASNGTASVTATGGIGAFTYTWSPIGGNASNASGLPAGNYSVNVTDANGCLDSASITINQPAILSVTLTATNASCNINNGSITANAIGGTGPYTYTWMPAGGNSNTANNLGPGTYSLIVDDINNCSVTSNTTITQPPMFTLTVTSTNVTCNGANDGSATANVIGGTASFNYLWSPTGGTNDTTGKILTAGNYTVLVSDAGGCSDSAMITIKEPGQVLISANGQTICNGQSALLTASASGGNAPYNYTWNTGVTGATISVNINVNATYTVFATDSKGCKSLPDTAMVNVLPPLAITVVSNDTTCAGQPATLNATASGGNGNYTITWSPGNATGNSIIVHPITTTIYTATVTDGCTAAPASAIGQVNVLQNPLINFNPNPASGCAPVCVNFAAVAGTVNGNDLISYAWYFGDGGLPDTGLNAYHCYKNSGSFSVYLLGITEKGCRDSVLKNNLITVFPHPKADFTASTFTTDVYDPTIYFYDQSQSNIKNWQWNFSVGSSTIKNPSYTFPGEGTYPVSLVVSNAQGCKDSIKKEILIKPVFTFYAPNAFTPNNDGMNESFLPKGTAWNLNTYNLWVFDRWGNQLYHGRDPDVGWDGTRHGEILMQDVYVWKVELKDTFGVPHEYNGIVSIVR